DMQQLNNASHQEISESTQSLTQEARRMPDWLKRFLPFISLIGLCVLIPVCEYFLLDKNPVFLTANNLAAIARQTAVITIMAMGMTMVMVAGGIDLSVGSIIGLAGVIGALGMKGTALTPALPVWAGILLSLSVGAMCGLLNGAGAAKLAIPPFIVTLGAMGIYRGLALYISDGNAIVSLPENFGLLAEMNLFGVIPLPLVIVIAIALIVHFALSSTPLGRYCY